jgi:hypothetical protein
MPGTGPEILWIDYNIIRRASRQPLARENERVSDLDTRE